MILLLIFAAVMFSCSSNNNTADEQSIIKNENNANQSEQSADIAADDITPNLPEMDFDGAEINFLVRGGDGNEWDTIDIFTERETGDSVNDVIFRRNQLIEDKYNVSIKETTMSVNNGYNTVNRLVLAGDTTHHAIIANAREQFTMMSNKLLLDLNEILHINLKNPWWDAALNRDMSILNKQLYAANATNLMAYDATWIAMFSKKLMQDHGRKPSDIYNMVREGTWTLDRYIELTKDFILDLDGDGRMTERDQFGTAGQGTMAQGFYNCAGLKFIEKDENDRPFFRDFDERAAKILELASEIVDNNIAFQSHNTSMNKSGDSEYGRTLLAENRTLFFTEAMICVRVLRDMADDFGVVPLPKFDAQANYTSLVHEWAVSLTSVPNNCANIEMTGIILEEMAYQSHKTVLPVYFDIAINGKYLRDEDSIEMIDYIMSNRVMDLGVVNNYGNLNGNITTAVYRGGGDFASIYERAGNVVTKQLENLMESIEK